MLSEGCDLAVISMSAKAIRDSPLANAHDTARDEVQDFIKKHNVTEIVYGDFLHAFPKTA